MLAREYPSDYRVLIEDNAGRFVARLRTGLVKEFSRIGDAYRLTRVADRNGNEVRLGYVRDALARIESQGHFIELVRAESGRVIEVHDELNRKVSYQYDKGGFLTAVTDLGGNVWSYQYTGAGRLRIATDPLGRENFKIWHQPDGRVREIELPSGRVQYAYDDAASSTTVTSRKGLVTRLFHNEQGITTRVVNPLGDETRIVLDAARNVQELWENGILAEHMQYDSEHRIVSRRSYRGGKETTALYLYGSAHGELTRIERSDGPTVELAYDASGNLLQVTDSEGTRSYQYSAAGDLTAVTKFGQAIQFQVNADGLVTGMTEDAASHTAMRYAPSGRLSEIRFADGLTARMAYDPLGLRRELRYSDGRRVKYTYDPSGNMLRIDVHKLDGTMGGQVLELDGSYQVRRQTLAEGIEILLDYDQHGNLIESREGERVLRFEYDALDRLTEVVTPSGQRLECTYASGEPSLITQMDHYTGSTASPRRDSGWTFAGYGEMFASRSDGSQFGAVRFDERLGRFQLSGTSGYEVSTRAQEADGPLARLRLVAEGTPLQQRQRAFQAPSNLLYLPAEYASINCCPICAYGPDAPPCEPCYEDPPPPPPPDPLPATVTTDDVVVIAWVDPLPITLPSGANQQLVNRLDYPVSCFPLLTAWAQGNPEDLTNDTDRAYANAYLVKNSGNFAPLLTINPNTVLAVGDFRLFNRFKVQFSSSGGSISNLTILQSQSEVGKTPDPCYVLPPVSGQAHFSNGSRSVTSSGSAVYQLTEGRIGLAGQAVNLTLNARTTPWIWSVIRFDGSGNLNSSDHAIFPTYYVYRNGVRVAVYPQSAVSTFVAKDSSYERLPSQIQ